MTRSALLALSLALVLSGATLPAAAARSSAEAVHDPELVDLLAVTMAGQAEELDHFDAEVWLMSTEPKLVRFIGPANERMHVLQNVYREANRHEIDPDLVLALIQVESAFDRFAVSSAGAQGLMQVMPFWRLEIGRPQDNLTNIETNVRYGTAILAHYIDVSQGDLIDALARYNGSRGRLKYPEKVVRAFLRTWQTQSVDQLPALREGCLAYALAACSPITFRR